MVTDRRSLVADIGKKRACVHGLYTYYLYTYLPVIIAQAFQQLQGQQAAIIPDEPRSGTESSASFTALIKSAWSRYGCKERNLLDQH
jgi:hypothetical protein